VFESDEAAAHAVEEMGMGIQTRTLGDM